MTVAELRAALIGQGWVVHGNKRVLVARLEKAQAAAAGLAPHVFVCAVACTAALTVVLLLFIMS